MKGKKAGKKSTVEIVRELVEPIVLENGLYLWDVVFEKEGASWYLRVFIDFEKGVDKHISYEECEAVSRPLDKLLDLHDPIEQSYFLEVGSPGIDRKLVKPEHFDYCMGKDIDIKLIRPSEEYDGREFAGTLTGFSDEDGTITITCGDGVSRSFKLQRCSYVRLQYILDKN